jgi:hypothetical protein
MLKRVNVINIGIMFTIFGAATVKDIKMNEIVDIKNPKSISFTHTHTYIYT